MALNESEPLSTTQISEKIAINSKGQLFKVSGALKDSSEKLGKTVVARPVVPFIKVLVGIIYILRTGYQWKMLP